MNGFDMQQMQGMVDAVRKEPQLAQATLYATVAWRSGFSTEASVKDFKAGGVRNETSRPTPFAIPQDHPPELGGTNKGATAGELLLASLGHCVSGGFAASAAVTGVPMDSLTVEAEGDVDLQGMLGLPEPGAVRPGFKEFRIRYYVKSRAPRAELEKVAKMAEDLSPVKDSLRAVKFSSRLVVV
jgi:uncharacterized OsmC-like protein